MAKKTKSPRSTRSTKSARAKTQKTRKTKAAPKAKAKARDLELHVDGCDVDFVAAEITPDSVLPPARGGVETPPRHSSPRGGRP